MAVIKNLKRIIVVGCLAGNLFFAESVFAQQEDVALQTLRIKVSFGLKNPSKGVRTVWLINTSEGMKITTVEGKRIEKDDLISSSSAVLNCGAGDVDELMAKVSWPKPTAPLRQLAKHVDGYALGGDAMWGYLMEKGSPGQSARLKDDSWNQPDAPILTVQLNRAGTAGFSLSMKQLLKHGAMWLPEQDVFITLADQPVDFNQHLSGLTGQRILDKVSKDPDASLEEFKKLWPDFGNPIDWKVSWQTRYMGTTGQLTVTAAEHGAVYKYAVDRYGNIRPDFASPHKFLLDLQWPGSNWKSQKIINGLPILVTHLENKGQLCEIVQFASKLDEKAKTVSGNIPSVMLTKVSISGKAGPLNFGLIFGNALKGRQLGVENTAGNWQITDKQSGDVLMMLEIDKDLLIKAGEPTAVENGEQVNLTITGNLIAGEIKSFIIKLPSPAVAPAAPSLLNIIDFAAAKKSTVNYWEDWIQQGAHFQVPEVAVNDLFRANLWHSLILPRHTIDSLGKPHMDLPYANTAYGQKNADWPINQAVYVDYMVYGLRGYDKVAEDEIAAMFKSQQQPDGRIGGFANWGVYSPGHLFAISQNYLLSDNKNQFERLLPNSIKTLDWCIAQIEKANTGTGKTGLILAPLNDLTNAEREWAFTQAYFVGGLEIFGQALSKYGHPKAKEVFKIASKMKADVKNEFSKGSVKSPVVQLADGTWINYVPADAMTHRRIMDQWYPTDVDTGPLHLSRLGVFEPFSWLTTAMLNDHEDNLFLKNQGAANEPVYIQQANTYLLRDEPKAVIRAFYSLMACGFSHEQYTSLEHRWAWGQYYGPPSTDGAWFEIYRKMLLNEFGQDTLMIGQAIPRTWLAKDKQIVIKKAPSHFGPVSFTMDGLANNEIKVQIDLSNRNPPKELLVRLRHPQAKLIRSVTVNGKPWKNFDTKKEYIQLSKPVGENYVISVKY
ncbi:MAG: hypothetical protein ACOH2A_03575 [Sphingobacteriaceae bacterium]